VTRRPRSRLPQKLPDRATERAAEPAAPPSARSSARRALKDAHVAGTSAEFGAAEVHAVMRRVARNERRALLGCAPFESVTLAQVQAAVDDVFGWDGDGRPSIAARATIDGFEGAAARILEVARSGGRLAFATSSPASLFSVHRALAAAAVAAGGVVFDAVESGTIGERGPRAMRLRWLDRVAMASDGGALLDGTGPKSVSLAAAEELLFAAGLVDLVVADRAFAGVASAHGLDVVAFAGLDAVALAVAAWRGRAVRVVPVDEHRPPVAYQPLLALLPALADGST